MSRLSCKRDVRRRTYFTGERYQQAHHEIELLGARHPLIPDTQHVAQQQVEAAVLHRLLHGARAQWPAANVPPPFPLFVQAVRPLKGGLHLVIPVKDAPAFGAALAMRVSADGVQPPADEIWIRRENNGALFLTAGKRPARTVGLHCSWKVLRTTVETDPYVSSRSAVSLRFDAHRTLRLQPAERAVLSGLLRRIALFFEADRLDWLFAWHEWVLEGRSGDGPQLPNGLESDLTDSIFGLQPPQLHTLGIEGAPQYRNASKRIAFLRADKILPPRVKLVDLKRYLEMSKGWDVLYLAKRIWQANSKDEQVAIALERTAGALKSIAGDQSSFFASMLHEDLVDFLRAGQLIEHRSGEVICRYGDPGESMFVILRGKVGVCNFGDKKFEHGMTEPKYLHGQGEVVGELAFALNRNRTVDLIAQTDVALLAFNHEEVKGRLRASATRVFDMFVAERVLAHTAQVAPYLAEPNRAGLPSDTYEPYQRVGDDGAWRDTLLALREHCQLITVDPGPLNLEFGHISQGLQDHRGLYVLVSGSLKLSGADVGLHGAQCPVLWVDLPNLMVRPPATYARAMEPLMVLRIDSAGIDQLELSQRLQLRKGLEDALDNGSDEYDYQVYLCHSTADKSVVRRIRDQLEENGIKCWPAEDEMLAGESVRRMVERGLLNSRYLLVCASANLLTALWANQEIDAVLHLEVQSRVDPKVLVLKLNEDSVETAIPLLLQDKRRFEYQHPGDFDSLVEYLRPSS